MDTVERLLSGMLRVKSILDRPDSFYDKTEEVGGWIRNMRCAKGNTLIFVELSDGSCQKGLQVVMTEKLPNFKNLLEQNVCACLKIKGKLVKSPAKGQPIEMLVDDSEGHYVEVLGENQDPANYPLAGKFHSMEHLRTVLHLRPRTNIIGSMARLRNALSFATHSYFQQLGFLYVHTPLITTSDCEGAGEMFQVTTIMNEDKEKIPSPEDDPSGESVDYKKDFFGKPAYLTVSGQLAVENYSVGLNNVYTFGPTFRAENSHTSRHLAEFWMIEPEMCFAGLEELLILTEGYVKHCLEYALKNIRDDLDFFNMVFKRKQKQAKKLEAQMNKKKKSKKKKKKKKKKAKEGEQEGETEEKTEEQTEEQPEEPEQEDRIRKKNFDDLVVYLEKIVSKKFERMEYTRAIEILEEAVASKKKVFKEKPFWGIDLSSEHERYLCEEVVDGPLFLYNYPADIKPFYMRLNEDKKTVQNMDLLLPFIGELVGGSVREERYDVLMDLMKSKDMEVEDYSYYLDLRKYGTSPHCGFGLGFERLVMLVSGLDNIRDAIPFPRYPGKCDC